MKSRVPRGIGRAGIISAVCRRHRLRAQADRLRTIMGRMIKARRPMIRDRLHPIFNLGQKSAHAGVVKRRLARFLAVPAGLEPATLSFEGWYSIR